IEPDVLTELGGRFDTDAADHLGLEALSLDPDIVISDLKQREAVVASLVGGCGEDHIGAGIGQCDFGALDNRAAGVGNETDYRLSGGLGQGDTKSKQYPHAQLECALEVVVVHNQRDSLKLISRSIQQHGSRFVGTRLCPSAVGAWTFSGFLN